MEEINLIDQIYNGKFLLSYSEHPDFPDGWQPIGGDAKTTWEWLGPIEGPRAVRIDHPSGPKAGIIQSVDVPILAGNNQRWEFEVFLETDPVGALCYIKVYLGSIAQKVTTFHSTNDGKFVRKIFITTTGTNGLRVEVGIIGYGQLTLHEIRAYRVYPLRVLRLDDQGQVYVQRVESIGQIQKPVSVQIVRPLPLPIDLKATISGDIRNLSPLRDGVRIYDSFSNPIGSTPEGALNVQLTARRFVTSEENVNADLPERKTSIKDLSNLSVYSWAIKNRGITPAWILIEISPDGAEWVADSLEEEIGPGQLKVLVPQTFLRFNRLSYRALVLTPLTIWFQAQC